MRNQAKLLTIKEMEDAGIDVLSDGEQGRTSFIDYLTEQIPTFDLSRSKTFADSTKHVHETQKPVGRLEFKGELTAVRDADFLRAHTKKPTKMAVISPNFLGNYWSPGGYYHSKDEFLDDIMKISKQEASAVAGKVDYVQWDDPGLTQYTEPHYTSAEALENTRRSVEVINEVIESAAIPPKTVTALHTCWGNFNATHQYDGSLMQIYPELLNLKVDMLLIELASARHEEDVEVFGEYPSDKKIAAGVIDVKTPDVEPIRIIKKRVQRVLKYVEPKNVMLTTDCGFAPNWNFDRIPRFSCYLKLRAMSFAAEELRSHGFS